MECFAILTRVVVKIVANNNTIIYYLDLFFSNVCRVYGFAEPTDLAPIPRVGESFPTEVDGLAERGAQVHRPDRGLRRGAVKEAIELITKLNNERFIRFRRNQKISAIVGRRSLQISICIYFH